MACRILFALPGLHRVNRGAEVAFESVAHEITALSGQDVTLIGSGFERSNRNYRFQHAGCIPREHFERWPYAPLIRDEYMYEELSFAPALWRAYKPSAYDITVTCSYPYTNWILRARRDRKRRPAHVYVTQNGDWPPRRVNREFRFFSCDALICTNPEYYERHREQWFCALIPNGVDPAQFCPGPGNREAFAFPNDVPVVLMVSALIPSKRVLEGIRCAARLPDVHLVVAGNGPLRRQVEQLGQSLMGSRFRRLTIPRHRMPDLYRAVDVLLHMSVDEPSANAYLEALATGLPIVTHDRYVTRWTLEDQAVLVDTTDETSVVEAIRRSFSLNTPACISTRSRLAQERFAWSKIAQQYVAFFHKTLQRSA